MNWNKKNFWICLIVLFIACASSFYLGTTMSKQTDTSSNAKADTETNAEKADHSEHVLGAFDITARHRELAAFNEKGLPVLDGRGNRMAHRHDCHIRK